MEAESSTYEDWRRLTDEFWKLREMPPERRGTHLDRLEPALARALRRLLEADGSARLNPAADFLETPLALPGEAVPLDPSSLGEDEGLGSFRILSEIGRGGMGRVYLAERADGAYRQRVAIKVLSTGFLDASAIRRFELERQILADLRHPNIARFLGGGALADGRPYLTMEYVEGLPIDAYCEAEALGLGPRIRLMLDVCRAVQAAHDHLIVHRDIKPSNLLVDLDGEPRLVDFGIAKPVGASPLQGDGMTTTFNLHVTPAYASPEHLLGRPVTVASDVYSLGVVLYLLVAGELPYDLGRCATREAMEEVLDQEPAPSLAAARRRFRKTWRRDRLLAADLERVIRKAMAKRAAERYASVRALEEDLERALTGGPVLAGRAPRWRRARAWMRRHRVATAVVAACLVWAAIFLIGFQLHTSRVTAQAAQAQYFTQRADEMAAIGRMVAFLPREELSLDPRQMLVERSEQLREELPAATGLARPAAHYALGRSLLSLRRLEEARAELEEAWSSGLEIPDVALALGETYGRLYTRELAELRRLEGELQDEERRRQLARDLRAPALDYLRRAGRSNPESADYVAGLIAFFEGRLERAAELAAAASERAPWLYEARLLGADVLRRQASRDGAERNLAERRGLFEAARAEYRRVQMLAPGAPEAFFGECEAWLGQVDMLKARERLSTAVVEEAGAACKDSLRAEDGGVRSLLQRAELASLLAHNQEAFGVPGWRDWIDTALGEARAAIEMEPSNPSALSFLGASLRLKAAVVQSGGGDPEPLFDEADVALATALRSGPKALTALFEFGFVALDRASWEAISGRDSRDSFNDAASRLQRVVDLYPDLAKAHGNLATVDLWLALVEGAGPKAHHHLERARQGFREASRLVPDNLYWFGNLGTVHVTASRLALLEGQDPEPHLRKAEELYSSLLERQPSYNRPPYHLAVVHRMRAEADLYDGSDPSPSLRKAREYAGMAEEARMDRFELPLEQARIEWLEARDRWGRSEDLGRALGKAREYIQRAEELSGGLSAEAAMLRAEVEWLKVGSLKTGSAEWKAAMEAAGRWLRTARERDPSLGFPEMMEAERARLICRSEGSDACETAGDEWARRAEEILPGVGRHAGRWRRPSAQGP